MLLMKQTNTSWCHPLLRGRGSSMHLHQLFRCVLPSRVTLAHGGDHDIGHRGSSGVIAGLTGATPLHARAKHQV